MNNGIIAFCGPKASGKSTSAELFQQIYSGPVEELAFAGHLKSSCSNVFSVHMDNFIKPELKEKELDTYVVLQRDTLVQVLRSFGINDPDYDKLIRPHVGKVIDSPRRLLQYIGTEVLHPIDPLIHAKITLALKDPNKLSLITDLRFVNEFNYLFDIRPDFIPVYIMNNRAEHAASGDVHPSEKEVFLFKGRCYPLDNNGSFRDLSENLKDLIESNL